MVNAFVRCLCVQHFRHRHLHNRSRLDREETLLRASAEIVMTITNNTSPRKLPRKPVGIYRYRPLNIGMEQPNNTDISAIVASYNLLSVVDKYLEFHHYFYGSRATLQQYHIFNNKSRVQICMLLHITIIIVNES